MRACANLPTVDYATAYLKLPLNALKKLGAPAAKPDSKADERSCSKVTDTLGSKLRWP